MKLESLAYLQSSKKTGASFFWFDKAYNFVSFISVPYALDNWYNLTRIRTCENICSGLLHHCSYDGSHSQKAKREERKMLSLSLSYWSNSDSSAFLVTIIFPCQHFPYRLSLLIVQRSPALVLAPFKWNFFYSLFFWDTH